MTARIAAALAGLGNSGRHYHLPFLLNASTFDLKAVAVGSAASCGEARAAVPADVDVVVGWENVVARPDVELVVVALPHWLHYAAARTALEHGKHVLVEKPMTMTTAEADDLIATAEAHSLTLLVHHQRRFEADFQRMAQLVAAGQIGEPWRIVVNRTHQGRYHASTPQAPHVGSRVLGWAHEPNAGGGVGRVIGPHPVDHLLTLAGSRVVAVDGWVHMDPDDLVDDWLGVDVGFASGLTGHVEIFRRSGIAPPRFTVYGSKGTIVAPDGKTLEIECDGKRSIIGGLEPPGVLGAEIYDDLTAAINEGIPPRITAAEAREVVNVLERAYSAAMIRRAKTQ